MCAHGCSCRSECLKMFMYMHVQIQLSHKILFHNVGIDRDMDKLFHTDPTSLNMAPLFLIFQGHTQQLGGIQLQRFLPPPFFF